MGMDVYGLEPTTERGEYFRNNVWWWRPLWDYCLEIMPNLDEVSGYTNDGDGLDAVSSLDLANALFAEIESGRTAEYSQAYNEHLAGLPRENCKYCNTTGIRTDEIGVKMGQPERALSPEVSILVGRTHGWCNGCDGVGTQENWNAGYPFSVENVRDFAEFVRDSGGFSIC
jgi:hypothetical protein